MDNAYEFICGTCKGEGTEPPPYEQLLELTETRLQEELAQWIDWEIADNDPIDDLRWARLCRAATAPGLTVPDRPTG